MPSKWGLVTDRLLVLSRRFSDILTKVQEFVWRLLELHIVKLVALFSVWVALQEVKQTICHLLLFFLSLLRGTERGSGVSVLYFCFHPSAWTSKAVTGSTEQFGKDKNKSGRFQKNWSGLKINGQDLSFVHVQNVHVLHHFCLLVCPVLLSAAVPDEPGPGGAVVSGHALQRLQAHDLLSVYRLGLRHHRV